MLIYLSRSKCHSLRKLPHPPIILPEIGHGEKRKIRKTIAAYRTVMKQAVLLRPETIILTSPHSVMYADYFHVSPGREAQGSTGLCASAFPACRR